MVFGEAYGWARPLYFPTKAQERSGEVKTRAKDGADAIARTEWEELAPHTTEAQILSETTTL